MGIGRADALCSNPVLCDLRCVMFPLTLLSGLELGTCEVRKYDESHRYAFALTMNTTTRVAIKVAKQGHQLSPFSLPLWNALRGQRATGSIERRFKSK